MSANRLKLNADKTVLLWAGSRRCCLTLGNRGRKLQLGDDTIVPANDVNVLVCVSSDLTMDTFPTSARPDFIGCGNFDVFGIIGHGVVCNPRGRHVPHRLLQCIVDWGTEGYN